MNLLKIILTKTCDRQIAPNTQTTKKQHDFPDLRKKKKPIQRQHENKKHNKTTNGTEGSGGYLRNFLAVSENKPFDWSICINLKLKFQCFQAANLFSPFLLSFFEPPPGFSYFVVPSLVRFF